eukprot:SAG31_NODE_37027_length_308_cov_0.732057_1_plen_68_part_01
MAFELLLFEQDAPHACRPMVAPASQLSRRARLTLEVIQAVRAGHPPEWVKPLATIQQPMPEELVIWLS